LAGVDLEAQKPADAIPLLNRATKIRPGDEVVWYRLAQAEHSIGDKEAQFRALDTFKRLHSSTPATLRKPDASDEITPQTIDTDAKP
jgi:predicted Zn-dependent protease